MNFARTFFFLIGLFEHFVTHPIVVPCVRLGGLYAT
jgi:hypothetical protein